MTKMPGLYELISDIEMPEDVRERVLKALHLNDSRRSLMCAPRHYIVRRFDPPTHDGVIELPSSQRAIPNRGVIVRAAEETTLKVGTEVIVGLIAGREVPGFEDDAGPLFIYHEDEIIAYFV